LSSEQPDGWTRVVCEESRQNARDLANAMEMLAAGEHPDRWDGHVSDYLESLPAVQLAVVASPSLEAHQLRLFSAAVLRRRLDSGQGGR
jgi:hypothetical protein